MNSLYPNPIIQRSIFPQFQSHNMPVIFDIKRFALHDGPGIRTTVFLKGCPLNCLWCHNPESHSAEKEEYSVNRVIDGKEITMTRVYGKKVEQEILIKELLNDRVFYEESGGGVTFSGGEPLSQHKELINLLKALGEIGIHRAVDTSGYAAPEIISEVAVHTDLFLYDLKLMDPEMHMKYTGVDNRLILKNADMYKNYDEYYLRYRRAVDSHNRFNVKRIDFQNSFLKKHPEIKPYLPGERQTETFRLWE